MKIDTSERKKSEIKQPFVPSLKSYWLINMVLNNKQKFCKFLVNLLIILFFIKILLTELIFSSIKIITEKKPDPESAISLTNWKFALPIGMIFGIPLLANEVCSLFMSVVECLWSDSSTNIKYAYIVTCRF